MKLTEKDKDFIEKLKILLESRDLSIELIDDGFASQNQRILFLSITSLKIFLRIIRISKNRPNQT
jgi:hypothetical protein